MTHPQDMFQNYMASPGYQMTPEQEQQQQQHFSPHATPPSQQPMHPGLPNMHNTPQAAAFSPSAGFPVQMYPPQFTPQQQQPSPQQQQQQQQQMNFAAAQGMHFPPNQNMRFPPGQIPFQRPQQQQQQQPVMNPNAPHPGMMYNNPAAFMQQHPQQAMHQQGMRPMPNPQFINTFSRSPNGYPMQAVAASSPMNPYQQQQMQQQMYHQQQQQHQFMHARPPTPQQYQHQIQIQMQQHHHQQPHQQPPQPQAPARPRRAARNTKKKVTYEESSEDEEDLVRSYLFQSHVTLHLSHTHKSVFP